ncbi:hypothetical protein WJX73_003830 [Symbiochloris irregularis]|uniref:MYND-type domain-containing protein n=1 Tax=Symbiochloris irregularis TaxID=706552 RepID=A0AAW1NQZ9_9CHLO
MPSDAEQARRRYTIRRLLDPQNDSQFQGPEKPPSLLRVRPWFNLTRDREGKYALADSDTGTHLDKPERWARFKGLQHNVFVLWASERSTDVLLLQTQAEELIAAGRHLIHHGGHPSLLQLHRRYVSTESQEYTLVEWRSLAHFISSWRGVRSKKHAPYVCLISHGSYEVKGSTEPLSAVDLPRCQEGHFMVAFRIWQGTEASSSLVALFQVPEQLPGHQRADSVLHVRKEDVERVPDFSRYQQGRCSGCDKENNGEMVVCHCGLSSYCSTPCLKKAWLPHKTEHDAILKAAKEAAEQDEDPPPSAPSVKGSFADLSETFVEHLMTATSMPSYKNIGNWLPSMM